MLGVISRIRRFRRDERGVVLMIFMLVVIPLLMVIAVAIDFGQTLVVKRQLTSAIDAAALTIGTLPDLVDADELNQKAEAYIRAHYPESGIGTLTSFSAVREGDNGEEVVVSASATVPTSFMGLAGIDMLTVNVNSRVLRRDTKLEIVMVLDNSGSMIGSKLAAMKAAATTLVDTLFGADDVSDKVKIGLVPFGGGVNVAVSADTLWLDDPNPAALNYEVFDLLPPGESTFDVLAEMDLGIAEHWGGCVRSRQHGFDITDAPPSLLNPDSLFSAYFKPFKGKDKNAYKKLKKSDSNNQNNENCPQATLQPLTNVKSTITSSIDSMTASTNTNIPEGLVWGWRVVSPGAPFTDGATYDQQDVIKAVILLTDGSNFVTGSFSSYGQGDASNPQLGPDVNGTLNAKLTTLCGNIKADKDGDTADQDIIVYTIAFDIGGSVVDLMRNCATDPGRFFDSPSSSALESAFAAIAASLNQLRLTH